MDIKQNENRKPATEDVQDLQLRVRRLERLVAFQFIMFVVLWLVLIWRFRWVDDQLLVLIESIDLIEEFISVYGERIELIAEALHQFEDLLNQLNLLFG